MLFLLKLFGLIVWVVMMVVLANLENYKAKREDVKEVMTW